MNKNNDGVRVMFYLSRNIESHNVADYYFDIYDASMQHYYYVSIINDKMIDNEAIRRTLRNIYIVYENYMLKPNDDLIFINDTR